MKRGILVSLILGAGAGLLITGFFGLINDGITIPIVVMGIGTFLFSFALNYIS